MEFKLTVLGTSAATPAHGRGLAAHVVQHHNEYFLIDCGEGTQFQLLRYNVKFRKINTIFISHLHGDHIFGLIGLLMNYELAGRKTPLHIYSPEGLEPIILIQAPHGFGYELVFHCTTPTSSECIWESNLLSVHTIPLKHRVPCNGFLFVEKEKLRNIKADMIKKYNIPFELIPGIKAGKNLQLSDGTTILNKNLTNPPPLPRKFAYCSDTR